MHRKAGLLASEVGPEGSRFAVILELGEDRALLESSHPKQKGEEFELRFFVPTGSTFYRVKAQCVIDEIRDDALLQYGARLREVDARSRRILAEYVASRKR